jgi:hypothetical protein
MAFEKGVSGNPAGRPKGSGEKTLEQQTRARKLLTMMEQSPKFHKMVDHLTPREFAMLYKDLLEFQESKMSRLTIENPDGNTVRINVNVSSELPFVPPAAELNTSGLTELEVQPIPQIENNTDGKDEF